MTDRSWKAEERRIAVELGAVRSPSNGRAQSDISAGPWAVECKKRKSLPAWLLKALLQARGGCIGGDVAR